MELPPVVIEAAKEHEHQFARLEAAKATAATWRSDAAIALKGGKFEAAAQRLALARELEAALQTLEPHPEKEAAARAAMIDLLHQEEAAVIPTLPTTNDLPHMCGPALYRARGAARNGWQPMLSGDEEYAEERVTQLTAAVEKWRMSAREWECSTHPLPSWVGQLDPLISELHRLAEAAKPVWRCVERAQETPYPATMKPWVFDGSGWQWREDPTARGRWVSAMRTVRDMEGVIGG